MRGLQCLRLAAVGALFGCWLGLLATAGVALAAKDTASAARQPVLLVMGDSLSAAFGIPLQRGWVALLGERLQASGSPLRVVNASVSGETTQGGLTRLPAELARHRPALVVIQLGANDGLRGQSLEAMRDNLRRMVRLSREAGARVLLLGMRIPPNYGPQYVEQFFHSFQTVANETRVPLVRFFLEKVALQPGLMQDDGLHPTAEAQPLLLDTVWPTLRPLLPAARPQRPPVAPTAVPGNR
jgi:acyl-CoA thioesterase-1